MREQKIQIELKQGWRNLGYVQKKLLKKSLRSSCNLEIDFRVKIAGKLLYSRAVVGYKI